MIYNNNKPRKSLPLLLEFYRELDKLEAQLQQTQAKIKVNYYRYIEYIKFQVLNRLLQGKALCRIEAQVQEQSKLELASSSDFLDQVEFVFKDLQAKERA